MAHQHSKGSAGAIEIGCLSIEIDLLIQPRVIEADGMTTTGKMPGRASTNGAGTDDGDREIQLSASAGITSAYASKPAATAL